MSGRPLTDRSQLARDIANSIGTLINRSYRSALYGRLTADLGDGIDAATYPVISGLARLGPTTAAELAAAIGIDRSVVSRHASRLEQAGLVTRGAHPDDRRATVLALSGSGSAAVDTMRRRLQEQFERAFADVPEELMRCTRDGLDQLVGRLAP